MVSKFLKIKCSKCKNEQIVFEKATTRVNCLVCNSPISEPSGGKSKVSVKAFKELE